MGAAEDDVVDGEVVEDAAGDDTIEAVDDTDGEIEDAEVIGEIGLLDPAVATLFATRPAGSSSPRRRPTIKSVAPTPEREAPLSFPRLHARTQRYTLGEPRDVSVSARR